MCIQTTPACDSMCGSMTRDMECMKIAAGSAVSDNSTSRGQMEGSTVMAWHSRRAAAQNLAATTIRTPVDEEHDPCSSWGPLLPSDSGMTCYRPGSALIRSTDYKHRNADCATIVNETSPCRCRPAQPNSGNSSCSVLRCHIQWHSSRVWVRKKPHQYDLYTDMMKYPSW